MALATNNSHCT